MKKYLIKDEDNATYEVTEVEEEATPQEDALAEEEVAETLTADELAALRRLIPHIDELVAQFETPAEDEDEEVDELEDADEDIEEEESEEEIVDTCKDSKSLKDSAVSNKKKVVVQDSDVELEDAVSSAWAKRYSNYR